MKNKKTLIITTLIIVPLVTCLLTLTLNVFGRPNLDDSTVASQADVRPANEPRLDPSLHDQLLQALNPPQINVPKELRDPFIDRAGLTSTGTGQPTFPGSRNPMMPGMPGAMLPANAPAGPLDADKKPLKTFAERYRDLQRRATEARAAGRAAPSVTTAYSITEIEIYGTARNGGVWVFGKPEDRSFTILPNAEFIDAIFVGIEGDQAIFVTKKGTTVKLAISRSNA